MEIKRNLPIDIILGILLWSLKGTSLWRQDQESSYGDERKPLYGGKIRNLSMEMKMNLLIQGFLMEIWSRISL